MFAEWWPVMWHGLVGAAVMFTALWIIQVIRKDAGVVDVGWTTGVGVMALYIAVAGNGWWPRRVLVGVLGAAWSLRLASYILVNRVLGSTEDGRYKRMRAYWGNRAHFYFYFFFVTQSILVVLFALPFMPIAAARHTAWRVWDLAGAVLWVAAVAGEWWADRQLERFRSRPESKGKTCRSGLWRYSRHPNYFFEWLHWWAYVLIAAGLQGWWLTLTGPVLMFVFLMRLTGIPYTEKQALASRGDDYRDYQRTTSMFFPLPPRKP
jgi:steroid 5-alpha reductase family enzyme